MNRIFLPLLFIFTLTSVSSAQLTLTKSNFTSHIGKSISTTNHSALEGDITPQIEAQMDALIQKKGQAQVWDFTVFEYQTKDSLINIYSSDPSAAVGGNDPHFSETNYIVHEVDPQDTKNSTWQFFTLSDTALLFNGLTFDQSGSVIKSATPVPPYIFYRFPLGFDSSWTVANIDVILTENELGGIGNTKCPTRIDIYSAIDGDGTLVIPGNTSPVVRLKNTVITAIQNVPGYNGTLRDTNISYNFMTVDNSSIARLAVAHQNSSSPFTASYLNRPAVAEYSSTFILSQSVTDKNTSPRFGITFSANPTASPIQISYSLPTEGNVQIQLMDVLGREVRLIFNGRGHSGENVFVLDPAAIGNGSYLLRITSGNVSEIQKLIIAK